MGNFLFNLLNWNIFCVSGKMEQATTNQKIKGHLLVLTKFVATESLSQMIENIFFTLY